MALAWADILSAVNHSYDNAVSLLSAETTQDAIDEVNTKADGKQPLATVLTNTTASFTTTLESAISANTAKAGNVSTALSQGTTSTTVFNITSDGGVDDLAIPTATSLQAGVMSSADKDRLDSAVGVTVQDNLTTQSATEALSANQGYVLENSKATTTVSLTAPTGNAARIGDCWIEA